MFVAGCNPPREEIIASIVQAEQKAADSNYGTDLRDAEKALVLYKQTLLNRRKQMSEAYRYDYALGLACGRLALIYERTGQTNQALAQMKESIDYFSRDSVALDVKAPGITEQAIREFIARLDAKQKPALGVPDPAEFGVKFNDLYDQYVQGDVVAARESLLATVNLLEQTTLPRTDAVAHGFWLTFARLHVLEARVGNNLLAEAYFLKAQFWYLRKLELAGDTTEVAMDHVRVFFTTEACVQLVDRFDWQNTAGPNYHVSP